MAETKKSKDNLSLWNLVGTTNVSATKEVSQGRRKFTAIDGYSQIMEATRHMGPMGDKWGIKDPTFTVLADQLVMYNATFFWAFDGDKGEIPMASSVKLYMGKDRDTGAPKIDDDCIKKLVTDALTKSLSYLGFNSDVFLGKFDDQKYVADLKEKQAAETSANLKDELIAELGITTDIERVKTIWAGNPALKTDEEFKEAVKKANNRLAPKPAASE